MTLLDEIFIRPLPDVQVSDARAFLDALDALDGGDGRDAGDARIGGDARDGADAHRFSGASPGGTSTGVGPTAARALRSGLAADRLAFAFAGGYQAAMHRLVGGSAPPRAALCATERGGAHPRNIATRLHEEGGALYLDGEKTFATLVDHAERLFVVASRGAVDGRNRLAVVDVPVTRTGVAIGARIEVPFAPEIAHAGVRFDRVRVTPEEVLAGDGYDRYLKPFRTIEDIHVLTAVLAYLASVARRSAWAPELLERIGALAMSLAHLADADPSAASTHRALGGLLAEGERIFADAESAWASVEEGERARWERDRPLVLVASNARAQRLTAARKATA